MMTDQFKFDNPIIPGSIWNKESDFTVPVASLVGNGPKGEKGDPTFFKDLTDADKREIYKQASFVANKSEDAYYTTVGTNTIAIEVPIADFDEFDLLFVDVEGLDLAENIDYTISGNSIVLAEPITHAGVKVHFRALSYEVPDGDKTIMNVMGRKDYNTVAEMQADNDLEVGDICHTLGFHEAGDGGAAWYRVVAHAEANGMDILDCGDVFAELIIDKFNVRVKQFGVVGDGLTDDTIRLQRCLNAAGENSHIFINCPNVHVSSTIEILNNNQHIFGGNSPEYINAISISRNSSVSPVIDISGKITSITGIQILKEFEYGDERSGIGIRIKRRNVSEDNTWYNMDCYIRKCYISSFDLAADCYGRNIIFQDDTHFSNCNNGVYYHSANEGADVSQRGWIVENCRFHSMGKIVSEDDFENPSYVGVKTDLSARCQEIILKNCLFDGNCTCFMYFGTSDGLVIDGNIAEFNSNVVIGYIHQPTAYYAKVYPVIQNNVIVQANNHLHYGIYTETILYLISSYMYFANNVIKTVGANIIKTSGGTLVKIISNIFEAISNNTVFFSIIENGNNTSAVCIGNTFDTEGNTQTGCTIKQSGFSIANTTNFDSCNFVRSLITNV